MLTAVTAESPQGGLLTLPLDDETSGILIGEIEGLGPVKATLVSSGYARRDGAQYNSSRREPRNLIFHLDLEPDYVAASVADLRDLLYTFFMPKTPVTLGFHSTNRPTVNIQGIVESCDPPMFTKEPKMDVVIVGFDPDFINYDTQELLGNSTAGTIETPIDYLGTVDTGINFTLNVNRSVDAFTIYHRSPDGSLRSLDFAAPLVAGDTVFISTVPGSKFVRLLRAGTTTSLLYAMAPYSDWIALQPGENNIRVYAEGAGIPFSIHHLQRYGGL